MIIGPIICLFQSDRSLIQKRYTALSDGQEKVCMEELNYIKNIKLPIRD
jgi:hypothetical protein